MSVDDSSKTVEAADPFHPRAVVWVDETRFRVDDVEFEHSFEKGSSACPLYIRKQRPLIEATVELLQRQRFDNIVELGIAQGGSTALLAMVADPRKLVAVELSEDRIPALDEFIAQRCLTDVVRPWFGVDQGDRGRLASIVGDEFGGEALDLVIDDASHSYEETRASFETLFPFLRPDGVYVIEDWAWQLHYQYLVSAVSGLDAAHLEEAAANSAHDEERAKSGRPAGQGWSKRLRPIPLETLILQLVLARACSGDVVHDLAIGKHWVEVRRGPAVLDPRSFRIVDSYLDISGILGDRRTR